ncbi:hypothetical protein HHI36_005607, partial [Cryptolaemus montrouzieri]
MLRSKLTVVGIKFIQGAADADRTILTTAVEIAEDRNKIVVVVSEDTDVLVLVTALTSSTFEIFFLKPAQPNKAEENNPDLAQEAQHFKEAGLSVEKLVEHGSQLLSAMYGASFKFRKPNILVKFRPSSIQLAETYRYKMYLMAVTKNKKVSIAKILPT